jgi:hypothetical protein
MRVTALLAIVLILAFTTAALGGPRQGPAWQPCDYNTDWKIDGTSLRIGSAKLGPVSIFAGLGSPGRPCAQRAGASSC